MRGRDYIQEQADKARRENPNLDTGAEFVRKATEAREAHRAEQQRVEREWLAESNRLLAAGEKLIREYEEGKKDR